MSDTVTLIRGGHATTVYVNSQFVEIVGLLSRDEQVRACAAYGSAELGDNDRDA